MVDAEILGAPHVLGDATLPPCLLGAPPVRLGPVLVVPAQALPEEVALEPNSALVLGHPGVGLRPTEAAAVTPPRAETAPGVAVAVAMAA